MNWELTIDCDSRPPLASPPAPQSQKPGAAGNYAGVFDAARKIAAAHGVQGIYQGLNATLLRNIPANAAYFWVYEGARRQMTSDGA